jgi:hypothetical protein
VSTTLEPLVIIEPCARHEDLLARVRYTVPAVIEECADCKVRRS